MMFTNKVYDIMKWVTMVLLPALGAFYLGLAKVWGFPYADQVSTTIILLVTFLGALLQLSNMQYKSYYPSSSTTDAQISNRMNPIK